MKRIDRLTQKQIDRFPEWVDKWTKIGLSTEPANWRIAEDAVRNCYRVSNLKQPKVILRMGSPYSATFGGILATLLLKSKNVGSQVWSQVWSRVGSRVRAQVGLRATLQYRGAQLWAGWYSYISFMRDVCNCENNALVNFSYDESLALSSGWTWWHDDVCAISDRMGSISRDSRFRLHNENGPALAYPDGWSIYAVHGIVVNRRIIESPETITTKEIQDENNAEIRRILLDKFGIPRYIQEAGALELSRDNWGVLYRINVQDDEPIVMVKYQNSTPNEYGERKEYFHRVHPELRPIFFVGEDGTKKLGEPQPMIPLNAIASFHGMYGNEYNPDVQT